ncbi:unnamed protein product [Spirodela intermedia]|uniref:Uncharacterized protein n=1 Tax=Spirodela intermedia TaxID=51605 RepID=A0A7I8J5S4_SPIIN|nr:unnamed protein product [Spirodela intermedia]CAA6665441.1 unnamed protein product [Spirodela intermedia]
MGKAAKRERLFRSFNSHAQSIHETFHLLDQPAAASLEKTDWSEVTKLGDEISKQATISGMLSTGGTSEVKEMEDHIGAFCNMLQGFLLLCQGSTVGAGRLSMLLSGDWPSKSSLGEENVHPTAIRVSLGGVRRPEESSTTNSIAIGRALTQVAVSVKDVLRELKGLRPAAPDPVGDDDELSPEEMEVARLAIGVVSDALVAAKEAVRFVAAAGEGRRVELLEGLLRSFQAAGAQVDELGACVFPPQEIPQMAAAAAELLRLAGEAQEEVRDAASDDDGLVGSLEAFRGSLRTFQSALSSPDDTSVEREMRGLSL